MKVVCDFCKTNFRIRGKTGKCPVCGRRFAVPAKAGSGKFFFAAAMFLLVSVFAVVALRLFDSQQKAESLVVSISNVKFGDSGYVVRGNIRNFSDKTYSVPDLVFVFKSETGDILSQVVQLPPGGIIEPMSDMEFIKKISSKVEGASTVSVRFMEK